MGILSKGGIEDKLKLAFDIYDYNDDGFIEKKEAEKIVQVSHFIISFSLRFKWQVDKFYETFKFQ